MEQNKKLPFSQIMLERFLLNELSFEDTERIKKVTRNNTDLQNHLNELKLSNELILSKYPPHLFERKLISNLDKNRVSIFRFYKRAGFAFGTVLTVLIVAIQINLLDHKLNSTERIKGRNASLSIYKKLPDGHKKLSNQTYVSKGDIIQIGYKVTGETYGTILSIDGRGEMILHFPDSRDESTLLVNQTEHFLKTSYELDDAPNFERFIFVTSDNPVSVDSILNAAKKIAVTDSADRAFLVLPKNLHQVSYTLKKRD